MTLAQRLDCWQNTFRIIQVADSQFKTGHQHGALPVHVTLKKFPKTRSDLKQMRVKASGNLIGDRMHLNQGVADEFNLFNVHLFFSNPIGFAVILHDFSYHQFNGSKFLEYSGFTWRIPYPGPSTSSVGCLSRDV